MKNPQQATPPKPKHHNMGFPYFPAYGNDLPLGVEFQVFGPYCFNSFALVFPTCEASSREIARDAVEKNMFERKEKSGGDLRIFFENCF